MDAHTRKTFDALTGPSLPHDLEWTQFERLWDDLADSVATESGDRLVVQMNGHRTVFHRPHDGRVSADDVEAARKLLADHPAAQGHGRLVVVAIDAQRARVLEFDLDAAGVEVTHTHTVTPDDPNAHHLRTVERQSGREDVHDLTGYYDDVAAAVLPLSADGPFVVLGHGHGKANIGRAFADRLHHSHAGLAHRLAGIGEVDLSAASDADLQHAARQAVGRS